MSKQKSNVMADFVQPILVLTLICLISSFILAYINNVTAPIIEQTENEIAEAARAEVLPEADSFTKLDVALPEGSFVTEVYKADNGAGYVFMITCNGYGGKGTMKLICGMDEGGAIVATKTLAHSETAGMGSKTADPDYRNQYIGKTADTVSEVDAITGATFSSNYYLEGIESAFEAYRLVK